MFPLSALAVLVAGAQLGQGLVVPAQPQDLEKRIAGTIPIQATTTNLWKYDHCQWDPTLLTLTGYTFNSNSMTPDLCASTCASKGFKYAGLRDKTYCGCSNILGGTGYPIEKVHCQYWPCAGNTAIACGGDYALGIYVVDAAAVSASVSQSISASQSASAAASLSLSVSQSQSASISASAAASASLAQSISQSQSAYVAASASAAASASLALSISQSQSLSASVAASVAASAAASTSLSQSISQSQSASVAAASASASASLAQSISASVSASAAAVQATQVPGQWVPQGSSAIAEGTSGRALTGASTSAADMTYFKCLNFCDSKNYAIAGLEYGTECYCGNALVNGASLSKTSTQGNMPCGGSASKICGGSDALTLFAIPSKIAALSADLTAKSAALPSGWSAASVACVAEPQNGRALTGAATSANDMTPAKCSSFCGDRSFKYAGVEYGSECYCGNSGTLLNTASSQCNMACSGDINTLCGGPGALNVFTNPSIVPSVGNANSPVSSGALPTGWSATTTQCIQEVSGRALTGSSIAGSSMTIGTCLSFCQTGGFEFAGLEYGSECYCGSGLVNGASLSQPSGQCNMACASDSTSTCGGSNALQLYRNPSNVKAAAPVTVINGFSSSGCIQEVSGRALTGLRVDFADMTIDKCTAACAQAGFKLAGVEYGVECYCGNNLVNRASLSLASGQCNIKCPGNAGQSCGGPNAIQLYTANN